MTDTTLNKYELYCETESERVFVWNETTPTVCPNNIGHTIDTDSIMIVDRISQSTTTIQGKNFTSSGYQDVVLDAEDNLKVHLANPLTGFGNVSVETPVPTIQIDGDFGLRNDDMISTAKGGCSVDHSNGTMIINSGTSSGYADIQSIRRHKYRPGQGTLAMFTAMYEPGTTGMTMLAGITTEFSGLYFGYNGPDFGILHENGGMFEVHALSVDSGVTSGNSTINLTLNDIQYDITVTPDKSESYLAWEIQEYFTSVTEWNAYQNENEVILISDFSQSRSGSYSVSHNWTLDRLKAGVSKTKTWTKQSDWNFDKLDGTGPTGMILDHQKGNVFKIQVQYLGFGNSKLFVENENTGKFSLVHVLKWSNKNTSVVYTNPSFRPKISISNKTATVNRSITTACMSMFNEGPIVNRRNSRSFSITKVGVGTTLMNLITLRNSSYFRNNINTMEVIPQFISISNISAQNSNTTIYLAMNYEFEDFTNYKYVSRDKSCVEFNSESNEIDTLDAIATYNLGDSNSYTINLSDIALESYDRLSIFGRTNTQTAEISVSITWIED